MRAARRLMLVSLLATLLPLEAGAALGEAAPSVDVDQARLHASHKVAAGTTYSVHEITTPSGTVVREFVSSATGQVFAVAWNGPFKPDLKQLLGAHFDTFIESAGKAPHGRGGVSVRQPDVVIHSGGHMRAFTGMAYLPGQIPEGFQVEDIH